VARRLKRRNERASDLAVRARDENSHAPNLFDSDGEVDALRERSLVEGYACSKRRRSATTT
jgi:hypothetical protein